jgi:transcriptional regulator with AAA-type ATPase domain
MATFRTIKFTGSGSVRGKLDSDSLAGMIQPGGCPQPNVLVVEASNLSALGELPEITNRGVKDGGHELGRYFLHQQGVPMVLADYSQRGRLKQSVKSLLDKARQGGECKPYVLVIPDAQFDLEWKHAAEDEDQISWSLASTDPSLQMLALLQDVVVPPSLREKYAGKSSETEVVRRLIVKASQGYGVVLVVGETGTGKEVVARQIHELNDRRSRHEFVPINCAGIPSELVESELFGNVEGAFTHATETRMGLWQAADHGTLFLDEIGELPLAQQAKVLRAIEDGEIRPLGTADTVKVDVRVIAATNRDLHAMTEGRLFRDDLYQRLCGLVIHTPSLKNHPEEIPALAQAFWQKENQEDGKRGDLPHEILRELQAHSWTGNMRELRQVLMHLRELFGTEGLRVEHIRAIFETRSRAFGTMAVPDEKSSADAYRHDCLRTLSHAAELVRSCAVALGAMPKSGRITASEWPSVRQTLEAHGRELEDLCRQPLWFHSHPTYQAIGSLLEALKALCALGEDAAGKALSSKAVEMNAAVESASAALFAETQWLGAVPEGTGLPPLSK